MPTQLAARPADPDPAANAVRSAALGEAARREATAALHRGDAEQARAWQALAQENGQPPDATIPAASRAFG